MINRQQEEVANLRREVAHYKQQMELFKSCYERSSAMNDRLLGTLEVFRRNVKNALEVSWEGE